MAFYPGQKVVCVDDTPLFGPWEDDCRPIKGKVYTIFQVGLTNSLDPHARCVSIVELGYGGPYYERRFRPVVERKTDIGFAHEILRKVTKPQKADA